MKKQTKNTQKLTKKPYFLTEDQRINIFCTLTVLIGFLTFVWGCL